MVGNNGSIRSRSSSDHQISQLVCLGGKFADSFPPLLQNRTDHCGKLFAGHLISQTLPSTADFNPLYYVVGKNEDSGAFIFKGAVYNSTDGADVPVSLSFPGVVAGTSAELTVLTGPEDPYGFNDPFTGINVVRTVREKIVADKDGIFKFELPNLSAAVLDTSPTKKVKKDTMRRNIRY